MLVWRRSDSCQLQFQPQVVLRDTPRTNSMRVALENLSLQHGFRLLSSYRTAAGDKLWVITEDDRSSTTLPLPDEYWKRMGSWTSRS
jgi:hypothetical protein